MQNSTYSHHTVFKIFLRLSHPYLKCEIHLFNFFMRFIVCSHLLVSYFQKLFHENFLRNIHCLTSPNEYDMLL